ncbi:neck protein [uncultured Mediterranean phage]|nr:neck protein [uncultured Mediterranean phage]|tara:strand:- start:256 stop:1071 length:816 start_codon:yes stop_codon:yes gene_type:complete
MAIPTTKSTFKEYCLRSLGKGVIDINVSDDQIDDRVDEALQYFAQYHYDGIEKVYLKHQITQADVDRAASNDTTTATDSIDNSITASFTEGKGFIPMPSAVVSVIQIFPFDDIATNNMFDIRYQLRLNDLYDFSSTSIMHYQMTMEHLDFLSHILVGEKPIRFNQHQNRLYIDMDFANDITVGEFIIIECYRKIDPATYTDIFDDIYLKRYASALIKRQWGANLSKFAGVAMLGGVTMNGEAIYSQAQEELEKLEEQIQLSFETPIDYMVG